MIGLVFLMLETQLRVTYPVTLEELKEALRREKSPKIRERIRIVLHVKSGLSGRKTAKLMGLSRDTVRRWVKRFNEKGFEGLKDRPRKGGEPKIDHKKIVEILETSPREFGYKIEMWTAKVLRVHLIKTFGVEYHPNYIYQLVKNLGYSLIKPRPESVKKPSEEERKAFKKR